MENLRRERLGKHMTLKELGDAVGVTAVSILRYERGEREPNISTMKKLSDTLGITVDELIAEENNETAHDPRGR